MRRLFLAAFATGGLFCGPVLADDINDGAVVGSEWVGGGLGISKVPGQRPEIRSKDVKLVIVEREGEKFKGILALDNGAKRAEVGGTIKKNGAVQFVVTKVLAGEAKDVVGLVKVKGKLKDGRMTLSFESTVGTKRAGAIGLELKDDDVTE